MSKTNSPLGQLRARREAKQQKIHDQYVANMRSHFTILMAKLAGNNATIDDLDQLWNFMQMNFSLLAIVTPEQLKAAKYNMQALDFMTEGTLTSVDDLNVPPSH